MITDRELTFSNDQAVTTGTQVSTDKVDTGVAGININTNRELQIFVSVTTTFTGGTSLNVNLVESASADLSSPTVLASSGVITEANLTAGEVLLRTGVPRTSKRYLGLQFVTVAGLPAPISIATSPMSATRRSSKSSSEPARAASNGHSNRWPSPALKSSSSPMNARGSSANGSRQGRREQRHRSHSLPIRSAPPMSTAWRAM